MKKQMPKAKQVSKLVAPKGKASPAKVTAKKPAKASKK